MMQEHITNESTDEWKQYKVEQKERRAKRLPVRQQEIEALSSLGYKVDKKNDYHYRIDDLIDVWPIHNRYHNIKTNKRGGYKNVTEFIKKQIRKTQ